MATALEAALNERQKTLLENDFIASAVFLDHRFNFLLTKKSRNIAKRHLKKLYHHLEKLQEIPTHENVNEAASTSTTSEIRSMSFESFLDEIYSESSSSTFATSGYFKIIAKDLESIQSF